MNEIIELGKIKVTKQSISSTYRTSGNNKHTIGDTADTVMTPQEWQAYIQSLNISNDIPISQFTLPEDTGIVVAGTDTQSTETVSEPNPDNLPTETILTTDITEELVPVVTPWKTVTITQSIKDANKREAGIALTYLSFAQKPDAETPVAWIQSTPSAKQLYNDMKVFAQSIDETISSTGQTIAAIAVNMAIVHIKKIFNLFTGGYTLLQGYMKLTDQEALKSFITNDWPSIVTGGMSRPDSSMNHIGDIIQILQRYKLLVDALGPGDAQMPVAKPQKMKMKNRHKLIKYVVKPLIIAAQAAILVVVAAAVVSAVAAGTAAAGTTTAATAASTAAPTLTTITATGTATAAATTAATAATTTGAIASAAATITSIASSATGIVAAAGTAAGIYETATGHGGSSGGGGEVITSDVPSAAYTPPTSDGQTGQPVFSTNTPSGSNTKYWIIGGVGVIAIIGAIAALSMRKN